MKNLRLILPGLALAALTVSGCFITSGQIFADYALPNPFTIAGDDGFQAVDVDLNTISDYKDHKDKLKDVADIAVVGTFTNTTGTGGTVEVWITPDSPGLTTATQIRSTGQKLWGPVSIGPTGSSISIGWDESADLFSAAGKAMLLSEARGDGMFTIYLIGSSLSANVLEVSNGALILTIAAGI